VGGELGRALGPIIIVSVITYFSLDKTPWLMAPGIIMSVILYVRLRKIGIYNNKPVVNSHGFDRGQSLRSMRIFMIPVVSFAILFIPCRMYNNISTYLPHTGGRS